MISATAALNTGGFLGPLKDLDKAILKFGGGFALLTKDFEGFGMIADQIGKFFDHFKETVDMGREMQSLSAETGQSVSDLMTLKQAFANADIGADAVQPTLQKFQEQLGGVGEDALKVNAALHRIGLSSSQLAGRSFLQQLQLMQQGFAGVTDAATRTSIAREIFGRGGGKMLSIIGNPEGMATAREQLGMLPGMMQVLAPMFEKLSVSISGIAVKFQQLWTGILSQVAPMFTTVAEWINRVDFTPIGIGIGVIVKDFLKLGEYISLGVIWFAGLARAAYDALMSIAKMLDKVTFGFVHFAAQLSGFGAVAQGVGLIADQIQNAIKGQKEAIAGANGAPAGIGMLGAIPQAHVGHLQNVGGGGGFSVFRNPYDDGKSKDAVPGLIGTTNGLLKEILGRLPPGKATGKAASGQPTHRVPV